MAKSSVSVKPLADRVLVEPAPAETKTSGGIIIPDTAKEKPMRGKIVAVGNGKPGRTYDREKLAILFCMANTQELN